nr:hypothetical protein [Xenorhabdus sp. Sc-CR9]
MISRSGLNKAAVSLANKNARIAWALVNNRFMNHTELSVMILG